MPTAAAAVFGISIPIADRGVWSDPPMAASNQPPNAQKMNSGMKKRPLSLFRSAAECGGGRQGEFRSDMLSDSIAIAAQSVSALTSLTTAMVAVVTPS